MRYAKPALSIKAQVGRLKSIGLVVGDEQAAERTLQFVSYFRLKGYFLPFMHTPKGGGSRSFVPGTTFDQVIELYQFDRRFRLLMMDEIERLEVAIRTVICNHLSLIYNPHWYVTERQTIWDRKFETGKFFGTVIRDTMRSKDSFAKHYYDKYGEPFLPPSWLMAECLSFGEWSRLYSALKVQRSEISDVFGLPPDVFGSWLHALGLLRNTCAHHSRLWNRRHSIRVAVLHRLRNHFVDTASCYSRMVITRLLTRTIDKKSDFPARLKALLKSRDARQIAEMGFPNSWELDPVWI